ncbi:alpha/beta fold hydrolase (plasmid) [Streptomyces sp. BI20]|uniref:alpha/beta fold hydrolase n=1 Tax=Streptomyces sp. BI20 TaxID=3403460 RepID=UPI003C75851D
MTWSERVVWRDGTHLSRRDRGGPGRPVVLPHELAGHAGEWDLVAERLAARHRVVAVDQRGHGASERRPEDRSRAAYVADVLAVLDSLDLREPVLVGQSMGGNAALSTAAAHPARAHAPVPVEALTEGTRRAAVPGASPGPGTGRQGRVAGARRFR